MHFWLCNVEYRGKLTPDAIRVFRDRTGSCLIGKTREVRIEFAKCCASKATNEEVSFRLSKVMGFIDIAYLIHALVIQESKRVTIEEIQDGMIHVGDLPVLDVNQDKAQGYIHLLIELSNLIDKEFDSLRSEKK
tara:strand:+ start:416 stop:817 length:402 start_codon:yes stop_codon:yes gene_type:complete